MATRIPTASRNAAADAVVDRLDVGVGTAEVRIYSGPQPASSDDAASGTLLATFSLPNPAFGAASAGVATANAIASTTGAADGTAGWFRAVSRDGLTVIDGACGTSGTEMILNTTTIATGGTVEITSWTVTMPTG